MATDTNTQMKLKLSFAVWICALGALVAIATYQVSTGVDGDAKTAQWQAVLRVMECLEASRCLLPLSVTSLHCDDYTVHIKM
jgi:hypothetical protein